MKIVSSEKNFFQSKHVFQKTSKSMIKKKNNLCKLVHGNLEGQMVFSFIKFGSHFRNRTIFFFLPYSYPPYITIQKTCKINFSPVATVITVKVGESYPYLYFQLKTLIYALKN